MAKRRPPEVPLASGDTPERRARRSKKGAADEEAPLGYRRRRREAERSRRRGRRRRRYALAVGILFIAAAAAAFFITRDGDGSGGSPVASTSTSTTVADSTGAYALRVSDGGRARVVALLVPGGQRSMVLGLPAETLVQGPSGFAPLDSLLQPPDPSPGLEGLGKLTGRRPEGLGEVAWTSLRTAVAAASAGTWDEKLAAEPQSAADTVAEALSALAGASGQDRGAAALDDLGVGGAGDRVKDCLRSLQRGAAVVSALPGKVVQGTDFSYYEPDGAALARLVGAPSGVGGVSVEVQNGSGDVRIAEKVGEVIAPLGFEMLPPRNADDFPDVEVTRIYAAPDAVGEADRIRGALSVGLVVKQDSLPSGRVVVVVGKDVKAESLPGAGG